MNSRNPANRYIYAHYHARSPNGGPVFVGPNPTYLAQNGERVFRTVRDKLGDIIRVYRAVHVHRPGEGYAEREVSKATLREQLRTDWMDAAQ